ncbi:MAG: HD domain-containing protein [Spirochaetota bacterium]|nr:HD domain-containing protein [Spirochaetota bacterium]
MQALAQALDMVEISFLGASTHHGKRIAVLCAAMGRRLGMSEAAVADVITCALLHDNALTEYILLLEGREEDSEHFAAHCEIGQRNLDKLPFHENIAGFILYHHERADGRGLFRLSEGNFPLGAELIAAADMFDVEWHLGNVAADTLPKLRESIAADTGARFTHRAGGAMLDALDADMLASLRNEEITNTIRKAIPVWTMEMDNPALISIAELVSHIIDCKSAFTKIHSQQIANRAWLMAEFYGYDMAQKIQLYLAAALHDIGKMAIPSAVLEKPGALTKDEFEIIKTHAAHTRSVLGDLGGLLTEWASNHHEKLDGSGYPLGTIAADLDFNSRLMTCLDIYQAVSEERPYHPRRSHAETMPILRDMADKGQIDPVIARDMDTVMAPWSGRDIDVPALSR